jgi:hypothetical protein
MASEGNNICTATPWPRWPPWPAGAALTFSKAGRMKTACFIAESSCFRRCRLFVQVYKMVKICFHARLPFMGFHHSEKKIRRRPSLYFRTRSVIIHVNQEASLVCIYWLAQAEPEGLKQGYELAVDLVRRFCLRNWLNDARNAAYINVETQNWIHRRIIPQLLQNNMHKLARVVVDEPLAILVSGNILDKISNSPELAGKLQCELFTDFDQALSWLHA